MSSATSDILAPSNAASQPSTAQLVAQVEALTRIVESSVVQSKITTVANRKKRRRVDARNLVRSMGPFKHILTIVEHGVTKALADSNDEEHEETEMEKQLTKSWNTLKDTIPGFSEEMIGLAGKRQLRKHVCSEIQGGLAAMTPTPSKPPSATTGTKADWGFNNPHTARLNTRVKHPATEETYTRIHNGELMYCDGHIYNPDDMEDGLLEGSTLFAVVKHIYQGPSTALKHEGFTRGRAENAVLNGITALTGHDIAYVAVQARFELSSQDQWGHMDGNLSYRDFYWSIVDLLKGEEGQEIINRFNMKVFGTKSSSKKSAPVIAAGRSDFEVLEAQCAAKRACKIAAAAASSAPA
ncbi:hypothetical protein B0H14DRAFT_3453808 [Mycena olivaceomarginata]|nr:hypothetical protein B0H14DRAFT_3453808 [Mycena olivaceomarginata]